MERNKAPRPDKIHIEFYQCCWDIVKSDMLTYLVIFMTVRLIHVTQTAFMKGRNITSGIMCLHEIMHETKRRKEVGVLLKIDFEKA